MTILQDEYTTDTSEDIRKCNHRNSKEHEVAPRTVATLERTGGKVISKQNPAGKAVACASRGEVLKPSITRGLITT